MKKQEGVLDRLASALGRRDEVPNRELAQELAASGNKAAITALVEGLQHKKKDTQNDCIKVLYEIGELKPALIAPYFKNFIALLQSKNNRLQWGAMTALDTIASGNPKDIYNALPAILQAAQAGSVITKDHAVSILVKLSEVKAYSEAIFPLLNEQLLSSPANQLPAYAEKAAPMISAKNKTQFINTLTARLSDLEKDSKRKRVEKVIQKISK